MYANLGDEIVNIAQAMMIMRNIYVVEKELHKSSVIIAHALPAVEAAKAGEAGTNIDQTVH
jgi:hypothetical protein